MHWPFAVVSSTSSLGRAIATETMLSPSSSFIAILPLRLMLSKSVSELRRTLPELRREHQFQLGPGRGILRQQQDRRDGLAFGQRQQIDQRLALRLRRGSRQTPDLHAVAHAARREEQHRRVRRSREHLRDEILVARGHAGAALAAAPLRAIGRERHALDVTLVETVTTISSRWIRSSSSTSPSMSRISVLRGVANSALMLVSSVLMISTMRRATTGCRGSP